MLVFEEEYPAFLIPDIFRELYFVLKNIFIPYKLCDKTC